MSTLYDKLRSYSNSDYYGFHMPGHKRRKDDFANPFLIDITEIEGFDNLHHAEGILKDAQDRAAALYHSEETYFLVNGSTCGILAAVSACMSMSLPAMSRLPAISRRRKWKHGQLRLIRWTCNGFWGKAGGSWRLSPCFVRLQSIRV